MAALEIEEVWTLNPMIDSGLAWLNESRRCSRDTYPESYITKYTSIRR